MLHNVTSLWGGECGEGGGGGGSCSRGVNLPGHYNHPYFQDCGRVVSGDPDDLCPEYSCTQIHVQHPNEPLP